MIKRLIIMTLAYFAVAVLVTAASRPQLILTTKSYSLQSDTEFSCHEDRINGYLKLEKPTKGMNTLESVWIGPDGQVQTHSETTIDFSQGEGQTAHVWLQLGNAGGALSGLGTEAEPNPAYNGQWTVLVKWNGQVITEGKFKVRC